MSRCGDIMACAFEREAFDLIHAALDTDTFHPFEVLRFTRSSGGRPSGIAC